MFLLLKFQLMQWWSNFRCLLCSMRIEEAKMRWYNVVTLNWVFWGRLSRYFPFYLYIFMVKEWKLWFYSLSCSIVVIFLEGSSLIWSTNLWWMLDEVVYCTGLSLSFTLYWWKEIKLLYIPSSASEDCLIRRLQKLYNYYYLVDSK